MKDPKQRKAVSKRRFMTKEASSAGGEEVREALRLMEARDQLRRDIREGLDSGVPTLWDPEEIKLEGRKLRASGEAEGLED